MTQRAKISVKRNEKKREERKGKFHNKGNERQDKEGKESIMTYFIEVFRYFSYVKLIDDGDVGQSFHTH